MQRVILLISYCVFVASFFQYSIQAQEQFNAVEAFGRLPVIETRLAAMNVDGSDIKMLLHQAKSGFQAQIRDKVISFLPNEPDHTLMQFAPHDEEPGVYRVNVVTDERA